MKGSCEDFCPEQEKKLRIKEKLLHFYELKNGEKNVPGVLVKSFSRSAAGVKVPRAKDLRSENCLQRTMEYLLRNIILDKQKPFNIVYDFIFDRLRAIRQEMVMQDFNATQIVKLLEPMIMFLAYSRYRLCEETMDNFDSKICDQHLQECLKRVLCCYDEIKENDQNLRQSHNRNFVESLYQLFNLGSTEALRRGLTLPKDTRESQLFRQAFTVAMDYYQGNFYRVVNGMQALPHILCATAILTIQCVRRNLYERFAYAYNSKQLTVPVDFLCRLTNHNNMLDVVADCKYYNIKVAADYKTVQFSKTDFKLNAPILKPMHENVVEDKLMKIYLPEVLLLKKL